MKCDCESDSQCSSTDVPVRSVGAHALRVLDYLDLREEWTRWPEAKDDQDVIDELLESSRAARRSFRVLAAPALRSVRLHEGRGTLNALYDKLLVDTRAGKGKCLSDLVEGLSSHKEVGAILEREGVSKGRMRAVQKHLKAASIVLREKKGTLILESSEGARRIHRGPDRPRGQAKEPSLLRELGRGWASRGRGYLGPASAPGDGARAEDIVWDEGLAHALVNGAWFFDRDVRDLEDRCGLPAIEGRDGGAVVGVVILVVGLILIAVASCVDDPDLSEALMIIGLILTVAGIGVLAASGVPVRVCRTDPVTGATECTTI